MSKTTILVTGGNTGLGFACCKFLAQRENTHVIVTGRNKEKLDAAVEQIVAQAHPSATVEVGVIDLNSLANVKSYCQKLIARNMQLSAIVCNAGVQNLSMVLTEDGYEQTFGVNHLAHFLLVKFLRERTERIVVVSSEIHDPDDTARGRPDVSDLAKVSKGGPHYNWGVAYATSKLCNVLFTKEFKRRYPNGPEIIAYTPGCVPDTELGRGIGFMKPFVMIIVAFACKYIMNVRVSTPDYSGNFMCRLAADDWNSMSVQDAEYIRVDEPWQPSKQARDANLARELWTLSERCVADFV